MTLDTLNVLSDPTAPKQWTGSRTIIFNVALTLVFALGLVGQLAGVFAIDPKWVALAGAGAAVVNFYLRLDTSAPISGTPAAATAVKAKQDLMLHAVMTAVPPGQDHLPAPPPADFRSQLLEFKRQHDRDTALLAEFAGGPTIASPSPVPTP